MGQHARSHHRKPATVETTPNGCLARVAYVCRRLERLCLLAVVVAAALFFVCLMFAQYLLELPGAIFLGISALATLVLLTHVGCLWLAALLGEKTGEKTEAVFIPCHLKVGWAHRFFTVGQTSMVLAAWGGAATVMLSAVSDLHRVQYLAAAILHLLFVIIFFGAASLRLLLLFLNWLGACTIYDPGLHMIASSKASDNQAALGFLAFCRRASVHLVLMALGLMGMYLLPSGRIALPLTSLMVLWPWALGVVLALVVLLFFARLMAVAFFFAKLSLRHVLGFNLIIGLLMTAFAATPHLAELWVPCIVLIIIFGMFQVVIQDPESGRYMPIFVSVEHRRRLIERIRSDRAKRLNARNGEVTGGAHTGDEASAPQKHT